MARLGLAITEAILVEYGKKAFLQKLSDPFWFQSFGAVLGMDWHSSGITTSVMGALKRAINPNSKQLGIYVCGGKGNKSRQTPTELLKISEVTGLNGDELVRCSKLSAKVDKSLAFGLINFICQRTAYSSLRPKPGKNLKSCKQRSPFCPKWYFIDCAGRSQSHAAGSRAPDDAPTS